MQARTIGLSIDQDIKLRVEGGGKDVYVRRTEQKEISTSFLGLVATPHKVAKVMGRKTLVPKRKGKSLFAPFSKLGFKISLSLKLTFYIIKLLYSYYIE